MDLPQYIKSLVSTESIAHPNLKARNQHLNHKIIRDRLLIFFFLNKATKSDFRKKRFNNKLENFKGLTDSHISTKNIKQNIVIFTDVLNSVFKICLENVIFPSILIARDVGPGSKNNNRTNKSICRPISILPNILKVYERWMYQQISEYFQSNTLSKY